MERIALTWEVAPHAENESPTRWIPATVPGAVQLDYARAHNWPPYWYADEWKRYRWMEDSYWTYRTKLQLPKLKDGQKCCFVCGGIDYKFEMLLNGELLHAHEGMFTPIDLELPAGVKTGDELLVRVFPAPKSVAEPANRVQANRSCKPAVSYEWDFHPRLVPLGIWQDAYLEVLDQSSIRSMGLRYTLSDDLKQVDLVQMVDVGSPAETTLRWELLDPSGKKVLEDSTPRHEFGQGFLGKLDNPKLWWPHDQGEPVLYTSIVQHVGKDGQVLQEKRQRIGFRRVRLVMAPGQWQEPVNFPKSRSTPPITLEINGRQIFCKGANWVSPEIFPGLLNADTYQKHLSLVKQSNMNMLRMWGGAPVQKQAFYDLCDELGIMVWQEFPLACNHYPDDQKYLEVLEREAQSIVNQLSRHPSVVLWCGGNELYNNWSGMTDQSHPLRLLNAICYRMDRHTPFLMTSPLMGMGHGHYTVRDSHTGQEAWNIFQTSHCTAYTEFGCASPASIEVLESIIPKNELFPPRRGTAWESHHAFAAWQDESHLYPGLIEHYFGPTRSLQELVERGQLLQAECYKGLFEEVRRQKPAASMALNWCLNEPWPTAANNSVISWPCKPKPALAAIAQALRPVLASARIRTQLWHDGDAFDPELWALSDSPHPTPGGTIAAYIRIGDEEIHLLDWTFPDLPPNANARGPKLHYTLPRAAVDRIQLVLRVKDRPELDSTYTLAYQVRAAVKQPAVATMNL